MQTSTSENPPVFEQFRESAEGCLAEAVVDREQGVVRNVALLGPESKNGYHYTLEAMQQAVPLYDQRPVFVDHPAESGVRSLESGVKTGFASDSRLQTPDAGLRRSVRDYAGRVVEPRFDGQRIRGDLHLAGPNTDWLLGLIESSPSDIGMSHVVLARWNEAGDAVEHIERVVSVDIVAFPATVRSFQEGDAGTRGRGDAAKDGGLAIPASPCRRVSESVLQLVEASCIPPAARTEGLYRLLEKCPEPPELIAELERYWREVLNELGERPFSVEKPAPEFGRSAANARQAIIAAVKGT